jgi:hypothetical protein
MKLNSHVTQPGGGTRFGDLRRRQGLELDRCRRMEGTINGDIPGLEHKRGSVRVFK